MEKNKSSQSLEEANIFFEEFKDKFQVIGYTLIKNTSIDYYRYRTNNRLDKDNKLNFDEWFDRYVSRFNI
jgi:hypothetical protein|tara:strand:- start:4913 stop:5122 length:210 start_codon:yes stop_codon:yes gene_type:complete